MPRAKLAPYKVLSPRVTDLAIEEALLKAWGEGYELKFVIPETGPRGNNVYFIMVPRKNAG
jgi:hypothetical protein